MSIIPLQRLAVVLTMPPMRPLPLLMMMMRVLMLVRMPLPFAPVIRRVTRPMALVRAVRVVGFARALGAMAVSSLVRFVDRTRGGGVRVGVASWVGRSGGGAVGVEGVLGGCVLGRGVWVAAVGGHGCCGRDAGGGEAVGVGVAWGLLVRGWGMLGSRLVGFWGVSRGGGGVASRTGGWRGWGEVLLRVLCLVVGLLVGSHVG